MTEPDSTATDAELAEHYNQYHDSTEWGEPQRADKPERLNVTISVRFTPDEIASIRAQAEGAGLKPTTSIRRCALVAEQTPIDRARLSRAVAALSRDLDDLRHAAG